MPWRSWGCPRRRGIPCGRTRCRLCWKAGPTIKRLSRRFLPGRRAGRPQLLKQFALADRVHGLPEAIVRKRVQLLVGSQAPQRFMLPHGRVILDIVEDLRGKNEKAAIDDMLARQGLLD